MPNRIATSLLVAACLTACAGPVSLTPASLEPAASASTRPVGLLVWTGPVRTEPQAAEVHLMERSEDTGELAWPDAQDAAVSWADITNLGLSPGQIHWRIELAGKPPAAAGIDRAETVIAYGLVLETNGDGVADYVVGIEDAPHRGDYRVWVTDLATGVTDEQLGPPYGFPVEFSHPDEHGPEDGPMTPQMVFTFIGGAPPGVDGNTRFYAWASVEEDGDVVAWDYAPNIGWLSPPLDIAAPQPEPVTGAGSSFPECRANAYDFIGESTLAALGLQDHVPAELPEPERPAMIWVTHDLIPHDFGAPGGPVLMTRMLCFEFADGSGGSGWPVDEAWQPPD